MTHIIAPAMRERLILYPLNIGIATIIPLSIRYLRNKSKNSVILSHISNGDLLLMTIGNRLRDLRTYVGLTQIEMARVLGIKSKTVSAYERGSSFPSLSVVVKAANYFGVSVDYIVGRTDNAKSHEMRLPENVILLKSRVPPSMLNEIKNHIDLLEHKYKLK